MTSRATAHASTGRTRRPARRRWLVALVAAVALLATACGDGPGNREDLVDALTNGDAFSQEEADCIATAVFNTYGDDEEVLSTLSYVADFDELNGPDGVEGFDEFWSNTLNFCVAG